MHDIARLIGTIAFCVTISVAIVQILFAVGVYRIASARERYGGPGNWCVSASLWTAATLFGGIFVAVAYWLIHDSRLSTMGELEDESPTSSRH